MRTPFALSFVQKWMVNLQHGQPEITLQAMVPSPLTSDIFCLMRWTTTLSMPVLPSHQALHHHHHRLLPQSQACIVCILKPYWIHKFKLDVGWFAEIVKSNSTSTTVSKAATVPAVVSTIHFTGFHGVADFTTTAKTNVSLVWLALFIPKAS